MFCKGGRNRRAARLRQSGVFCLRWCPYVWPFTNQVTGLSLPALDGHIRKVRSRQARAVCKPFPVATLLTFGFGQEVKSRSNCLSLSRAAGWGLRGLEKDFSEFKVAVARGGSRKRGATAPPPPASAGTYLWSSLIPLARAQQNPDQPHQPRRTRAC